MSLLHEQASELMLTIGTMTSKIIKNIYSNDFAEAAELMSKRLEKLTELVALFHSKEMDKKALLNYLIEFRRNDQAVMDLTQKEHERVRSALSNMTNLNRYITG